MNYRSENGFSLIELLLVVVIIGIVAAIAVPSLQKGIIAAENGATFSTLRHVSTLQVGFFSQNARYARISELNDANTGSIGTTSGDTVVRGKYVFEMTPVPSNDELRDGYTVTATRTITNEIPYVYELKHTGEIEQVYP